VAHVELLMCLLAGCAGGLVGTLWSGTVSAVLIEKLRANDQGEWHRETLARLVVGALLYASCGAALGFLFWLGWGLVALVNVHWLAIGLAFGALCWTGGALPALGMLQLRLREPRRVAAVLAVEWLVACLAVGVLCALTWHRVT
jgi:hypothetical protein